MIFIVNVSNISQVYLDKLQYFIYDEADKMTQMGAFRNEVAEISEFIPPEIKVYTFVNLIFDLSLSFSFFSLIFVHVSSLQLSMQ